MWYIWLIIAGIAFTIEIFTVGFLVFWFGIGALISMIVSFFCPGDYILQTSVFVISSTLLIFLTKPLVNKFTKNGLDTVACPLISMVGFMILTLATGGI